MTMRKLSLLALILAISLPAAVAQAGPPVRIGIGIGIGPYYRPYYPYYPYYYGYPYPYPYPYVVPGPVVVQAPPVVVQPGTVAPTPSSNSYSPSFTAPEPTQITPTNANAQTTFEYHLARLTNPDEALRRESVMELGRSKNERAIDPLAATLAGDKSVSVRDAAARALGLIASSRSLPALIHAAQADNDRDVRHSAQFAVEIIRSNLQRN
jgi:HEAT repeats